MEQQHWKAEGDAYHQLISFISQALNSEIEPRLVDLDTVE